MKGLRIDLTTRDPKILFGESTEGAIALSQNCLVNLAQKSGTSRAFSGKGTPLLRVLNAGGVFNISTATNVGAFAAIDTVFFARETSFSDVELPNSIRLVPEIDGPGQIRFRMTLKTNLDQELGASFNF